MKWKNITKHQNLNKETKLDNKKKKNQISIFKQMKEQKKETKQQHWNIWSIEKQKMMF